MTSPKETNNRINDYLIICLILLIVTVLIFLCTSLFKAILFDFVKKKEWLEESFSIFSSGDISIEKQLRLGFRWGYVLGQVNNRTFWSGFWWGILVSIVVSFLMFLIIDCLKLRLNVLQYLADIIKKVMAFNPLLIAIFLLITLALVVSKQPLGWTYVTLIVIAIFYKEISKTIERLSTALYIKLQAPKEGGSLEFKLPDIRSFSNLMEKLYQLLENTGHNNTFRFLAYTPALGYLALSEQNWNKLQILLKSQRNLKMLCLDNIDLKIWHDRFIGRVTDRGVITDQKTENASEESKKIIDELVLRGAEIKEVVFGRLPGYYIFSNGKSAIVAAPLFMPLPAGTQQDLMGQVPQMLGFETDDPLLVMMIENIFDLYFYKVDEKPSVHIRQNPDERTATEGIAKLEDVQAALVTELNKVIICLAELKDNKIYINSIKTPTKSDPKRNALQAIIESHTNQHNHEFPTLEFFLQEIENIDFYRTENPKNKIILEIPAGKLKQLRHALKTQYQKFHPKYNLKNHDIFVVNADRKYHYRLEVFEGNLEES